MPTLFISDLHLSDDRPEKLRQFESFLAAVAGRVDGLYVLGDLFEVSVGDDDTTPPQPAVVAALRRLSDAGTPLKVMHGNRDFFLGPAFARETGAELLADPYPMQLHGQSTLLMHGDLLCTDDVRYQDFRRRVRDPAWQQRFLQRPLWMRKTIGVYARWRSRNASRRKPDYIMDVTPSGVARYMGEYGSELLIHGHTHRPGIHDFDLDGRRVRRIVLGDWYGQETVLLCSAGEQQLVSTAECLRLLGVGR